jgi:WD40 repeat protein
MADSALSLTNPFRGLESYKDNERLYGRDADLLLIRDRVYSGRTTLLFAATGVGKTSFLKAKLLPDLKQEFRCCYLNEWTDPDIRAIVDRGVRASLGLAVTAGDGAPDNLVARIREAAKGDRPEGFLLILDQFEEVFQYHAYRPGFPKFVDELSEIVNRHDIPARVILSMRDDFLGELSVFDNRIPDLFNNYYRLKNPDMEQAAEIIRRTTGEVAGMKVEPKKLASLVADLSVFERGTIAPVNSAATETREGAESGSARRPSLGALRDVLRSIGGLWRRFFAAPKDPPKPLQVRRNFVIPPYLQIVCQQLWIAESKESNNQPFAFPASYRGNGAARVILKNFSRDLLDKLDSNRKKDLAARAFDYLMTREGAKMAYEIKRLAEHMETAQSELEPILNTLYDVRLLRRYNHPDGSIWFELYHDMYAPIVYEWKRDYQAKRAAQRKVAATVAAAIAGVAVWVAALGVNAGKYSYLIDSAKNDYQKSAYDSLHSNLLFGWLADPKLAAFWDRRAAAAEQSERRDDACLFRLRAIQVHDSAEQRLRVTPLLKSYAGLQATFRMADDVTAATISPDDKWVATGSRTGGVQLWDFVTHQPVPLSAVCTRPESSPRISPPSAAGPVDDTADVGVKQLVFSSSAKSLASLGADGTAHVWDLSATDQTPGGSCQLIGQAAAIALAPTGKLVAVAKDGGRVEIRPVGGSGATVTGTHSIKRRAGEFTSLFAPGIIGLTFSKTGTELYTSATDGSVYRLDAKTGSRQLMAPPAHSSAFSTSVVSFSLDTGRMVLIRGKQIELWNTSPPHLGAVLGPIEELDDVDISFSANNQRVLVCANLRRCNLFDVETGEQTGSKDFSLGGFDVAMNPDGSIAAVGNGAVVALVDMRTGRTLDSVIRPDGTLGLEFSKSGATLLTIGRVAQLWDVAATISKSAPLNGEAETVVLSANGQRAAKRLLSRLIQIVDSGTGNQISSIQAPADIETMVFSADGKMLATALKDGSAIVWSVDSGARSAGPFRHFDAKGAAGSQAPRVLFSPRGDTLVTSSPVKLWRLASSDKELCDLSGTPQFTPDGDVLTVRTLSEVSVIRTNDCATIFHSKLNARPLPGELPIRLAFDPFDKILAIAAADQVQLINWISGGEGPALRVHASALAFTPRGGELATVQDQSTLGFWRVPGSNLVGRQNSADSIGRLVFRPAEYGGHELMPYLITVSRSGGALQLWNLDAHAPQGDKVQLPWKVRFNPVMSADGESVVMPDAPWIHTFAFTSTGLSPGPSALVPGTVVELRPLNDAGTRFAIALRIGPVEQLATVDLLNNTGPAIEGQPDDLVNRWQGLLALRIDDQGKPANLYPSAGSASGQTRSRRTVPDPGAP